MIYPILLWYVGKHIGIDNIWYYILLGFLVFCSVISFGMKLYEKGKEQGRNDS